MCPLRRKRHFLQRLQNKPLCLAINPGADPLANTKALFANIRTNILDQATTQSFGYAPTLTTLSNDYEKNVHPVMAETAALLSDAHNAVGMILLGTTTSATQGTASPNINNPSSIATDALGHIYAVNGNYTISKITGSTATLFAGQPGVAGSSDGPVSQATFTSIGAIAVDSLGNVYVSDNSTIREITTAGVVSTLAGQPGVNGAADGTGSSATFYTPYGIAVDTSGNVYVADTNNGAIRMVTPAGVVTTTAAILGCPAGIAIDGSGNAYVTDFCNQTVLKVTSGGVVSTLAGDTGIYGHTDGVGVAALFSSPFGITIDGTGNLYVADSGNAAVRMVSPAAVVSTLAKAPAGHHADPSTSFGYLGGIALAPPGGVYVADGSYNSVQEVSSGGLVTTLIHGLANYQGGCGYDPVGHGHSQ